MMTLCFFGSIGRRLKEFWTQCETFLTVDSGGVGLALATAKKILTVGIQFLTVGKFFEPSADRSKKALLYLTVCVCLQCSMMRCSKQTEERVFLDLCAFPLVSHSSL